MKYVNNIMYGIFLFVLILGVGVLVAPTLPYIGHVEVKIVKSGSMEPEIRTGGIVVIREVPEYSVGDVVTFTSRTADIPTTHRIIGEEMVDGNRMLITKGDANEEQDASMVSVSDVIGRVLFDIPYVGFILDFARQPLGFGLLIGIPAFLIILDEIEKIWTETRRRRRPGVVAEAIPPLVVSAYEPPRKVRAMDMRVVDKSTRTAKRNPVVVSMERIPNPKGSVLTSSTVTIVFAFLIFSIGAMGTTLSYLSDIEFSEANLIDALGLGFEVTPVDASFVFEDRVVNEGGEHTLPLTFTLESESVPLLYGVSTAIGTGTEAFCNAIIATSNASGGEASGPITTFELLSVDFGSTWDVLFDLEDGPYDGGATCVMDIIIRAWDASKVTPVSYLDEEIVRVTFTSATGSPELLVESFMLSAPLDTVPGGETGEGDEGGGGGSEVPPEEETGSTTPEEVSTTTPEEGESETPEEEIPIEPTEPVTEEEVVEEEVVVPTEEGGEEEVPPAVEEETPVEPVEEEPEPEPTPEPEPEPEPTPEETPAP